MTRDNLALDFLRQAGRHVSEIEMRTSRISGVMSGLASGDHPLVTCTTAVGVAAQRLREAVG